MHQFGSALLPQGYRSTGCGVQLQQVTSSILGEGKAISRWSRWSTYEKFPPNHRTSEHQWAEMMQGSFWLPSEVPPTCWERSQGSNVSSNTCMHHWQSLQGLMQSSKFARGDQSWNWTGDSVATARLPVTSCWFSGRINDSKLRKG